MVFAPEHADQGLPPVIWGSEVVPEVTDYKYFCFLNLGSLHA